METKKGKQIFSKTVHPSKLTLGRTRKFTVLSEEGTQNQQC